ncbi:MAG: FliO/MopB family protein [Deltaproteobacteria bacterium]|nr:FliO/MopB family protein [Deltaproteobacteria bacterium]
MVKTVVALTVVLLLAWLTLHKGMGRLVERAQAGKRLRVVERVALDARRSLFLVEVDGRTMVVGGGDVVRLDSLPTADAADASLRASAFDKVLASPPSRAPSTTTSTLSTAVPTEPA